MVAALAGATLLAGITAVPLAAGSDGDAAVPASAPLPASLVRVGEPPPVPGAADVAVPVPATVPVTTPAALSEPSGAMASGPDATPALTSTTVVPAADRVAVPATVAASPPTTRALLAVPPLDPATLVPGAGATTATSAPARTETGLASWFGAPAGTCAHRTAPFGAEIAVTRLQTGAVVTCTVDDRGPADTSRVIDLSTDTFEKLAPTGAGLIDVKIEW
ncbi:MAG: hypothetical protein M3O23_04025 [Actinomycetota bacterium]|nr:hypothetical protein [Actinomycetota bacterium]